MTTSKAAREAYQETLIALGAENPNIVVLDADVATSTLTAGFGKAYPERFFSIGIAEADMAGIAAGFAASGKTPFISTFAIFMTGRAYDQIRNSIAYPKMNVKIVATHAGLTVGEDGATHQSVEDIGLMRGIPNMAVIAPADAVETAAAVRLAAAYKGPVYIRMGRSAIPVLFGDDYKLEWGKANIMRQGKDITLAATGMMTALALEAADQLAIEGISAEVINVPFIKPFDNAAILASVQKTGAIVTAEEHSILNGLGSAVAELLSEQYPAPLQRVGLNDTFGESGKPEALLEKYGLTTAHIVQAAKAVLARK